MTSLLLAQLEHIDLSQALGMILGTSGSSVVLWLLVRQWIQGKLRELRLLKKHRHDDRIWKVLARQRMANQGEQIERLSRNLHYLRNWATAFQGDLRELATKVNVDLDSPEQPSWDVTQPGVQLPPELIESGKEDEGDHD